MKTSEDELNPFKTEQPITFHNHLTLWNLYEAATARARNALMLCGIFAGVLLLFSIMTALDDAHQREAVEQANARATASNVRTLRLIDYLNKVRQDSSRAL